MESYIPPDLGYLGYSTGGPGRHQDVDHVEVQHLISSRGCGSQRNHNQHLSKGHKHWALSTKSSRYIYIYTYTYTYTYTYVYIYIYIYCVLVVLLRFLNFWTFWEQPRFGVFAVFLRFWFFEFSESNHDLVFFAVFDFLNSLRATTIWCFIYLNYYNIYSTSSDLWSFMSVSHQTS